jgi:hypothetical protein
MQSFQAGGTKPKFVEGSSPISLQQALAALKNHKFRPMTEELQKLWPGIRGKGYIWEPDDEEFVVICDLHRGRWKKTVDCLTVAVVIDDNSEYWKLGTVTPPPEWNHEIE